MQKIIRQKSIDFTVCTMIISIHLFIHLYMFHLTPIFRLSVNAQMRDHVYN